MKERIIEMLNQFGIDRSEYCLSDNQEGIGFTFDVFGKHSLKVVPITVKIYTLEIDGEWTLSLISWHDVPLVAATALTALMRQNQRT
jgi:hypothetical protein